MPPPNPKTSAVGRQWLVVLGVARLRGAGSAKHVHKPYQEHCFASATTDCCGCTQAATSFLRDGPVPTLPQCSTPTWRKLELCGHLQAGKCQ